MIQDFSSYPDWKAPGQDSAVVVWPEPAQILRETTQNHRRMGAESSAKVQGVPLAEWRRRQRADLNLTADRPVIATGHQTELFHPGVWGKLAMIGAAASKIGAEPVFVAVASDAPKHLQLRWPGKSMAITDDPRLGGAEWCGLLSAPSADYVRELKSRFSAASAEWSFTPMVCEVFDDLLAQSTQKPALSAALTAAMQKLDRKLGLNHQSTLASSLWCKEPYLALTHHLLANAGEFAAAYNQALGEYRLAHGIDNPGRPMPDLSVSDSSCEVPFWLDNMANQTRARAAVRRDGTGWKLSIQGDAFVLRRDAEHAAGELRQFLERHNSRLAPRALTLTMFFRLLVVDQWVHGIGGGRYEQVNDRVIHRFFGIEPPAFSVTTATLYFPEAIGRARTCLPCLAHEGHRLRHAVMGPVKMELVRQIRELPRRSMQRQRIFSTMHTRLAEAVQIDPNIRRWEQRMGEAIRRNADEERVFDRELFYAIQPEDRLRGLIERYADRFTGI